MTELDQKHHTFIQALIRRGPLSEKESKSMFRALFRCSNDKFFDFISTINKEVDYVQMEVRGSANQYDGTVHYGLVNKFASDQAKLGTRFTPTQLSFFKAIMEAILLESSATGVISSMEALNLRLDSQADLQSQGGARASQAVPLRLTLAAKEETLASLVAEKWLKRTEDGRVALGLKSFVELKHLFKDFDVPFCDVCNEAAIKAQPCQNEDCNVRMHTYCVQRKFSRRQVAKVCPGCGAAWTLSPASQGAMSVEHAERPTSADGESNEDNQLEEDVAEAQETSADVTERPPKKYLLLVGRRAPSASELAVNTSLRPGKMATKHLNFGKRSMNGYSKNLSSFASETKFTGHFDYSQMWEEPGGRFVKIQVILFGQPSEHDHFNFEDSFEIILLAPMEWTYDQYVQRKLFSFSSPLALAVVFLGGQFSRLLDMIT